MSALGGSAATMTEAVGAPLEPLASDAHLLQPIVARAASSPKWPVAAYRDGERFVDVTAAELLARIRRIAKGLIALGVEEGDRVVLMSHTRLEWLLTDYAILAAGGVTVPAYETSSAEQLEWIVSDSGSVALVVEDTAMAELFASFSSRTPECRTVHVIAEGGLDEIERRGEPVADSAVDDRIAGLDTGRLATIVYTSGTTGRPKGCALTHGNLRTNVVQNLQAVRPMLQSEETCLLFLPLAHVLTKIIALVGTEWGVRLAFATDIAHLPEEMAIVQPTMVVAVPRIFEKIFNKAQHHAHQEGHGAIFEKAADAAIAWSRDRTEGRFGPVTSVEHAAFDRLVYRKVRAVFGGRLRFAFSGGGPLGERLTHFYNGIGVKVFEGYGLTETSPTLTLNRAGAWLPGTVGEPLAGTTIRIADDGEILAKGPQVFAGYWHDLAATEEIFDPEGWFRTGDIGRLESGGFLRITGRKKELIVTSGGKNVAPAPLEDRLRAHPLISQAVVVGDNRPFIAAMVTLDQEAALEWAAEHGLLGLAPEDLATDMAMRAEIDAAVADANASVSRAESIRQFAILSRDFTIESGELTPTLKVRRGIIVEAYGSVVEDLYG